MDHLNSDLNSPKDIVASPKIMSFQNRLVEFAKPILDRVQKGWREPRMPRKIFYPHIKDDEESKVPIIVDEIQNSLKPTMNDLEGLFNTEFNEILSKAIKKVLLVKVNDGYGNVVDFFEGTYTVVVTTEEGEIIGGAIQPIDKKGELGTPYKKYGQLTPYALSKAILQWALWLGYRHSGIVEGDNYDHLKKMMGEKNIFLGSTVIRVFSKDGHERWLNVGVSGAQGSEYLLHKHFSPDQLEEHEDYAGATDQMFANLLEEELEPWMLTEPKPSEEEQRKLTMEDFKEGVGIEDENITFEDFLKLLKRAS